jgi:MOSC domain-containing protein YiiM
MPIRIEAISAGVIKPLWIREDDELRSVQSGIDKRPVSTIADPIAIEVKHTGITCDEQADPIAHGGIEKALYVYPQEHYSFWTELLSKERSTPLELMPGYFGENLTISGLLENEVYVGDRLLIGAIECAVTKLREPCYKFTAKTKFSGAAKTMVKTARSGWYLRVLKPGFIQAGDAITLMPGPRQISIASQNQALIQKLD